MAEVDGVAEVEDRDGNKLLLMLSCKRQQKALDYSTSFKQHIDIICSTGKAKVPQAVRVRSFLPHVRIVVDIIANFAARACGRDCPPACV